MVRESKYSSTKVRLRGLEGGDFVERGEGEVVHVDPDWSSPVVFTLGVEFVGFTETAETVVGPKMGR